MKRMREIKKPTELRVHVCVCVCVCVLIGVYMCLYVSACLCVGGRRSVGRYLCSAHIYLNGKVKLKSIFELNF
jgi:hypothetical protein